MTLTPSEQSELIDTLHTRYEDNMSRHTDIAWEDVLRKLESNPEKLMGNITLRKV